MHRNFVHDIFVRAESVSSLGRSSIAILALMSLIAATGCINGEGLTPGDGPATDSSAPGGMQPSATAAQSAPAIPNAGDVLIAGGADASNHSLASAEFFDPVENKFELTGTAARSRADVGAAGFASGGVASGKVLFAGGFSGGASVKEYTLGLSGAVLAGAELFDQTTGAFAPTGAMAVPRVGFTTTRLNSGKVLFAGGLDGTGNILDTAEVYDPATGKFTVVNNPMSDRRVFHAATLLPNGKVMLSGGVTNLAGGTTNSGDIYDPNTNFFTPTNFSMDHARAAHTATLLTTGPFAGDVLIAGGGGGSTLFLKDSTAEIFDPGPQQFLLLSSFLNEARSMHTATLLDDGTVLIAGGFDGSVVVSGGMLSGASGLTSNSAEIFDPITQDFTCVKGFNPQLLRCNQSMSAARAGHSATVLTAGTLKHRVLIAGGIGGANPSAAGTALASAEVFNPANGGSFKPTGPMSVARALHTATLLR